VGSSKSAFKESFVVIFGVSAARPPSAQISVPAGMALRRGAFSIIRRCEGRQLCADLLIAWNVRSFANPLWRAGRQGAGSATRKSIVSTSPRSFAGIKSGCVRGSSFTSWLASLPPGNAMPPEFRSGQSLGFGVVGILFVKVRRLQRAMVLVRGDLA